MTLEEKIAVEAKKAFPFECVGFVLDIAGEAFLFPCENIAPDKTQTFLTKPEDYLAAEKLGKLTGYYHSHPNGDEQHSQADKAYCEKVMLPSYVYSVPKNRMAAYMPSGYSPSLTGRPFVFGVFDCVTLAQDYYEKVLRVKIQPPVYDLRDLLQGSTTLIPWAESAGFHLVNSGPVKHDLLLMNLTKTGFPNHAAIYIGDNRILHQLINRASEEAPYGGYWKKNTLHVLRR